MKKNKTVSGVAPLPSLQFSTSDLSCLVYDAIGVRTRLFLSLTKLNLKFYASGAVIVTLAAATGPMAKKMVLLLLME